MTIRNINHYTAALWDWGCFAGCFGTSRIRVSDLDGIIERNGYFLVLEAKSIGAQVTTGQQRMFNAMACTGLFTVVVIWGEPGKPERIRITTHNGKHVVSVEKHANLDDLRALVTRWYRFASVVHADKANS